ncbi:two-component sensor histidine kinase [Kribbella sp. ALI-6-A]|uniref:sensor histidine kinase n=1 Tax=Kribbella sp. ALI-6-A TaxID=1933817 RepID=UPI00097C5D90|nr:histidine kinase [Kribbella sp. ALI-6-A]ONI73588.1 two-component sensor histidine kinase [Kribbella sp. ALI-6-A]
MTWRRAGDFGLWAGLSFLVIAESGSRGDPYWLMGGCVALLAAAVLLRRTRPLLALAVVLLPGTVIVGFTMSTTYGTPIALVPAVSLLAYLAGRRETQLRYFVALISGSLVLLLAVGLVLLRSEAIATTLLSWLVMVLLALVLFVLPWLIGRYRAQQALLATAGWERAERIEREQRMEIEQVRLRERSRIAEDMHDSVGHELSLIALRAAALEVDAELPERHRRAATELREAAATATERLGEIIGVLRDADAQAPVVPSDESVAELVDRAAASGLAVRLVQEGAAEASPMVDRAIHRVVQESLTNASKHAPGAEVVVTLTRGEHEVVVRITDTGATRAVPEGVPSSGTGLAGLAERIRLVGGTLTAGPREDGSDVSIGSSGSGGEHEGVVRSARGFEVVARIPRAGGRPETGRDVVVGAPDERSATADERDVVRRRARRGLITALLVPTVLGAAIGVIALGYYLVAGYNSVLRPERFDALRIGQSLDEVEPALPRMQMIDPPSERVVEPEGWTCRFYRPDGPFSINYAYRLCFEDNRLVAKEIVQTGSIQPTIEADPTDPTPAKDGPR